MGLGIWNIKSEDGDKKEASGNQCLFFRPQELVKGVGVTED